MSGERWLIRPIRPADDESVAGIIRSVMPSFGADGPGFAIHDAEVDAMAATYQQPRWAYYVVDLDGEVVGGAGIAPLAGGDEQTCELKKMYFMPWARGIGAGRALLARCLDTAKAFGFRQCYLETLTGMDRAQLVYQKAGFERICAPMGATGHHGCDRWYLKSLVE